MPIYHYECRESSEHFPNLDTKWRSRLVKISHTWGKEHTTRVLDKRQLFAWIVKRAVVCPGPC